MLYKSKDGRFQVEIAADGALRVKNGDWLSKYSAAIHDDYSHVHEFARKSQTGQLVPIANPNLIYPGETLYHLPTATAQGQMKATFSELNCIALHDARLEGEVYERPYLTVLDIDQNTSLHSAFAQINMAAAGGGKIAALFILCHGYAGSNEAGRVCLDAGGRGLQLGKEDVLISNVSTWQYIADNVENIVVYACAAADTQTGNEFTWEDGKYLMGALAIHANATVFAADKIQWYNHSSPEQRIVFGDWEGNLWKFSPDRGQATQALRAPVEFDEAEAGVLPPMCTTPLLPSDKYKTGVCE
jgi:hypothetical protein